MDKIYYKKDKKLIPFREFLQEERERRGATWKEMDKLCGVKKLLAYVGKNSAGKPNNPPLERFESIISALGYSRDNFVIEGRLIRRNTEKNTPEEEEEYKTVLRKIGDFINQANEEKGKKGYRKLSSTLIRRVAGESFYSSYGNTVGKRRKLYQDLINISEEYSSIELQHQRQEKTNPRPLTEQEGFSEEEAINDLILRYFEHNPEKWNNGITHQMVKYVKTGLNLLLSKHNLPQRSFFSVKYHTEKLWSGWEKPKDFTRGSPKPNSLEEKLAIGGPVFWLKATRELETGIFGLAGRVNEKGADYFEKKGRLYFTAEAMAALRGEKKPGKPKRKAFIPARPKRKELINRIRDYPGPKISTRQLDTLSQEELIFLDEGLKQGKNPVELLGEMSRIRREEYFRRIYSHPTKALWREKWREFIRTNILTDEETTVLCLPGPEALEITDVYDQLGIARRNITGVERDPERYLRIESKNLGIELVNKKLFGFLAETDNCFDIIMLDFDGSFTRGKGRGLEELAAERRLKKDGLLGTNFFRKEADTAELIKMLAKQGYIVTGLERYVYQTVNGNSFYSDFFRTSPRGRRIRDIPKREELNG